MALVKLNQLIDELAMDLNLQEEQKQPEPNQNRNKKKQKQKKEKKQSSQPEETKGEETRAIDEIELRVGLIQRCWVHESADKLYCEEIDVGEAEPRLIASGLRPHYSLEEMTGRKVIVVCNLKAKNLVGFKSHGMVLCGAQPLGGAEEGEKVKFVDVPPSALPGDIIALQPPTTSSITTESGEEHMVASISSWASAGRVEKKKLFKKVVLASMEEGENAEGLFLNEEGVLVFGAPSSQEQAIFHVYSHQDGEDKGICSSPDLSQCIAR